MFRNKIPKNIDYSNTKIYCISSFSRPDLKYYGFTVIKHVSQILGSLKSKSKQYVDLETIIQLNDYYINVEETFSCKTLDEAKNKLNQYIFNNHCINRTMNNNKTLIKNIFGCAVCKCTQNSLGSYKYHIISKKHIKNTMLDIMKSIIDDYTAFNTNIPFYMYILHGK